MQAPWLLMIETDYVWMRPLQAPSAEDTTATSLAFPFNYINPQHPNVEGVMRKMYPAERGPLSDVPGSGPAPVMMRLHEWTKVCSICLQLLAHVVLFLAAMTKRVQDARCHDRAPSTKINASKPAKHQD